MRTYTYGKLTKATKEHAREVWREQITYANGEFDSEAVIDDAKEIGKLLGFEIEHVYWSGFSSQGDGACFEGTWRVSDINVPDLVGDIPQETKLHEWAYRMWVIKRQFPNASLTVKHSGHYYHEHCTEIDVSIADDDGDEYETPEATETQEWLTETCRSFMKWIYKRLEDAWDYECSDENIAELLKINEYEFDYKGDRLDGVLT